MARRTTPTLAQLLLPPVLCICVFSVALFGGTWAWFSAQSNTGVSAIQASKTWWNGNATSVQYATDYNLVYPTADAPTTLALDGEEETTTPTAPTGYEIVYETGEATVTEDGTIELTKGIFNITLTLEGTASYGYFSITVDHPWFEDEPYYFETNALAKGESITFRVSTGEAMKLHVVSTFCVADRTVPGLELFDGDTTDGSPYDFTDGTLEAEAESIRADAADALQTELARIAAEEEAARLEAERLAAEAAEAAKKAEEEAKADGESQQPENPAEEKKDEQPTQSTAPAEESKEEPKPEQPAEKSEPTASTEKKDEESADKSPSEEKKDDQSAASAEKKDEQQSSESAPAEQPKDEPSTPAQPETKNEEPAPEQSVETPDNNAASEESAE